MEKIMLENKCDNLSKLCKKIVRGDTIGIPTHEANASSDDSVLSALAITNSASISEMCEKIARGKIAIIIEK